jgi:hypothetical protein
MKSIKIELLWHNSACLQETAKSVIEDDSFYSLSLLKRGVCHGFAPQTFVCCVCNCSLSKEDAISAVRVFSCGHATHLHCESEQSKSSNKDSKDGCPICLSTSNTQTQNKSPIISENGLPKYPVVENEVSYGIHHNHESEHVEKSRGIQQMSRVGISWDSLIGFFSASIFIFSYYDRTLSKNLICVIFGSPNPLITLCYLSCYEYDISCVLGHAIVLV